ncbi:MAG: zinc ribbon domain-containing protein [Candidatus Bipolaricaulota bacterium]|nr:MAG: zinc ribbon domain-containing protein [Candidatus Bipolaricaulota bacterium]
MPIYRYQCLKCQTTFKVLQRNGSEPPTACPECGAQETERLLPRVGVIYKGSGYYSTDYRGKRGKAEKEISATRSKDQDDAAGVTDASSDAGGSAADGAKAASRKKKTNKATPSSTKE